MFFLCSLTSVNKGLVFTAFERGIPRLKEFSVCVCPMVVWMPVWIASRHHFFKDLLFVLKLGPFCQDYLDFLSWFSSDCGWMQLLLETAPGHPKFLVSKSHHHIFCGVIYYKCFIISPITGTDHSSLLSADHHSLAAAPSLISSTVFSFLFPRSRPYPPWGSVPSSVPSVPPVDFILHCCLLFPVGPASSVAWSRCVWCFCEMFCSSPVVMTSPSNLPTYLSCLYLSPSNRSWAQSVNGMNSCWLLIRSICFIRRLIRATKPSENTVILAVVPQR